VRLIATGRVYGTSAEHWRGRKPTIIVVCCLALASAASLAGGLVSEDTPPATGEQGRRLSATEAGRLATMRLHNHRDGRAGVRGTLGHPGEELHLTGWIDWQRPLAYLSVTAPTPGPADGLIQAQPGLVAVRPGRPPAPAYPPSTGPTGQAAAAGPGASSPAAQAAQPPPEPSAQPPAEPPPPPPATPPADGWRIRPPAPAGSPATALDSTLLLLFAVGANQGDATDLITYDDIRWLGTDTVDGVPVDILIGPPVPAPGADPRPSEGAPSLSALAAYGGAIRYWLDADGRLRRLQAVVGPGLPLRLDFDRDDRPELATVDVLGGRPTNPRPVTDREAQTLARLPQRNRAAGGGAISLEMPGPTGELVTASGWLDWRRRVTYLAVRDAADQGGQALLRAEPDGVVMLAEADPTPDGRPPLTPPDGPWRRSGWGQDRPAQLDLLLGEALALAGTAPRDAQERARAAVWLRTDVLHGVPVTVYEVPKPTEDNPVGGDSALRYWIDSTGVLRRLEVRGPLGGYGHLDIRPDGRVPRLPTIRAGD